MVARGNLIFGLHVDLVVDLDVVDVLGACARRCGGLGLCLGGCLVGGFFRVGLFRCGKIRPCRF